MSNKRPNETIIGNPGRLEYYPLDVQRAEDRGWLTVRNHASHVPETRELGSHHEWLATASHSPSPVSNRDTWHEIRKQKTWLLKSHPEAVLGNSELGELLAVGSSSGQTAQTSSWQLTQFAAGEMTDTSNGQEVIGAPLIAMAAGSAGDVLRIVRPVSNIWQLDNDGKANVHLLEHAQHQETLWTKDIGTIQRIRAIVSTRKFEPVRWLAVQREFGTSVFRPEYQKVPVVSETFSATEPQAPSYIAPNLLFTIPKSQTGCNLHCDVAFNPGARSKPAQLAIIDEGGNWSIWDVTGTRKRTYKQPRAHLTKCGSILDGILARLPRKHTPNPQWHKVLWLGHSSVHDDDFDEESPSGSKPASVFPSLERSSTLLLCNQKMLRLLDVDLEEFLPDLRVITDGSKDLILDVQLDSQDPRYFYVTTTLRVFVAAVFTPDTLSQERTIRRALILESFPHLRNKNDRHLKLTVTAGPTSSADRTSLVVLYSQHSKWHDVFYIGFSRKFPERIVCHHGSLVSRCSSSRTSDGGLQTLCLHPTLLMAKQPLDLTLGAHAHSSRESTFFQIFSFGTNFSLSYCLGMSSNHRWKDDLLSIRRLPEAGAKKVTEENSQYRSKFCRLSRVELERKRAVRYLSTRFVLADSVAEFRYRGDRAAPTKSATRLQATEVFQRMIAPVMESYRHALTALLAESHGSPIDLGIYGDAPFDPVFIALQEALETKSFPRKLL
ncbi:RNA polymerase I-specific transcription-initiation factor-domain-containing protein [Truncatella angustata]|uniref:RNA polymerase I-specific transcription-initiation factor-domain-containing protein n=1 Tax=Truncatella angustata TaxID=152316 RepID=A0A9P8RGW2_9PEZI|nr:RNA polymerase I-specific transcription-initiation factor-domain-containing protein [Truncatella angustata]KAH6645783.1 RNA polymerase I-specific transcription-initiation factor-domain-containing protein [Truncatella angustata]